MIDRLPEPPSPAAARGTLVHAVLERLFDEPAAARTPQAARDLLEPQWQRLVADEPEMDGLFSSDDERSTWLAEARDMLDRYFTLEDPTRLEPAERELSVEAVLESGLVVRGYVDRVDVAPGGQIRIVDYKTGTAPKEEYEAKALFQMKFYAVVLWLTERRYPRCFSSYTWATARSCDSPPTSPTCAPRCGRSTRCGGPSSGPRRPATGAPGPAGSAPGARTRPSARPSAGRPRRSTARGLAPSPRRPAEPPLVPTAVPLVPGPGPADAAPSRSCPLPARGRTGNAPVPQRGETRAKRTCHLPVMTPEHNPITLPSWRTSSTHTALADAWDEMFAAAGRAQGRLCAAARGAAAARARVSCGSAPTSWPASSPTAASRSPSGRGAALPARPRARGSSTPPSGTCIERGVQQRVRALEAFLADVYGRRPGASTTVSCPGGWCTPPPHFHRAGGRHRAAERGAHPRLRHRPRSATRTGDFRVLEDNVRVPSGVSYVIENRRAMTQTLPDALHRAARPARSTTTRPAARRAAGRRARRRAEDPSVVVLTPGVYNSAYFEHALLARLMGVELVEGRDLVCRGNRVCMRTTPARRRVDVDLPADRRRLPRPAALPARLGDRLPGHHQRRPRGQRDDRQRGRQRRRRRQAALHLRAGPDPLLPRRGAAARQRRHLPARRPGRARWVLDQLDRAGAQAGRRLRRQGHRDRPAGRRADARRAARARSLADPRGWIAQRPVALSTVADARRTSGCAPRHIDLRPFAVNDGERRLACCPAG